MDAVRIALPPAPALVAGLTSATWLTPEGEIAEIAPAEAAQRIRDGAQPILCHAPATARRLGLDRIFAYDVLELFAFVRPTGFCVPTPRGLADALRLGSVETSAEAALLLVDAAERLLEELAAEPAPAPLRRIARTMAASGWSWGESVLGALGERIGERHPAAPGAGLEVWRRLPQWSEHAPPPPPAGRPVTAAEARHRLATLLGEGAEPRPSQADYAATVVAAFRPRAAAGAPRVVLAEAGTGVGKTLGYIAPASVWAEKNEAPVWISTYTRNLQHQIDQELDRLFPDPAVKAHRVVLRKGRENYLCLLNMEEAVRTLAARREDTVALGLLARWAGATRDGDMTGGDFPAWLVDLLGYARTLDLTDHHGECVYAACPHYDRCFIERGIRRARRAELVIANHALVMIQATRDAGESGTRPTRFVFDEGHHVFDAADSVFSARLTGREAADLRRWLRGAEGRRRSRARGLRRRLENLLDGDTEAAEALDEALRAAAALPSEGWHRRAAEGRPRGPAEAFLAALRAHVYAGAVDSDSPYDLEAETDEPAPALLEAAERLAAALAAIEQPLAALRRRLVARLDADAASLDTATRLRLDSMARSIEHRGETTLGAWRDMLTTLGRATPDEFVDWFAVERSGGRDLDIGMYRHWIDPMRPFA